MSTPQFKHREALFDACCAEIIREKNDPAALAGVAARVLARPDVHADAALTCRLRGFIAQQQQELAERLRTLRPDQSGSHLKVAFDPLAARFPTQSETRVAFTRQRLELEERLAHYDQPGAARVLERLRELARKYPCHLEPGALARCEQQYEALQDRLMQFRTQLDGLHQSAAAAAQAGDEQKALWVARRLAAVHALLPEVLPHERYQAWHEQIVRSCDSRDRQAALERIRARQRAVADEIKQLGALVHRYQKLAAQSSADPAMVAAARQAYQDAVAHAQQHGRDWLAGLMVELDALLGDLDDSSGKAEAQVEQFVEKVRAALTQVRQHLRPPQPPN